MRICHHCRCEYWQSCDCNAVRKTIKIKRQVKAKKGNRK